MPATSKHVVMLGDLHPALNSIIVDNGNPVDLADYTVKFRLLDAANTVILDDVTAGVTAHPTQTFTLDSTNGWVYCEAHGYENADIVIFATSGNFTSSGVAAATRYFVVQATPDNFKVSLVPDGAVVPITGAGTGTHTVYAVGSVQMDFSATEVDAAGRFKGYWRLYDGDDEISTFPKGEGEYIPIVVQALG